jgi:hypothetical protein
MAEVKTLTYKVVVDGKEVTKELKSIEDYTERIGDLNKELSKTPIGSKDYKKLQGEIKKTEGSLRVAESANQSFLDSMASTPGIIGTVGQSLQGVGDTFNVMKGKALAFSSAVGGKATKGLKLFKVALASTGIGLLVVALGSLIAYFTQTEKGTRVIKVAMEALGVIVGEVVGYFASLGENIIAAFNNPKKALLDFGNLIKDQIVNRLVGLVEFIPAVGKAIKQAFSGEFSAALKTVGDATGKVVLGVENVTDKIGDAVSTVVEKTKEAVKAGDNIVGLERKIRDTQQALIVRNAEIKKQLEEQRKIADNTTLSYEERQEALKKVNTLNDELAGNIVKEAKLTEDLLKQQIKLEGNYEKREELETQLAQATAERIGKEQEASIIRLEAAQKLAEIDLQEIDRKKAIGDIIKQTNLETVQSEFEKAQETLRLQEETAMKELDKLKATEEEKLAVKQGFEELNRQLNEERQAEIDELLNEKQLTEDEKKFEDIEKEKEEKLLKLEELGATEEQKAQIIKQAQDKIDKVKEDSAKKQMELDKLERDTKLGIASQVFDTISSIAGEQSAVGKAAAVASAGINTYLAANNALANTPAPPPFPQIAAGMAIVSGLLNVKKILSVKTEGVKRGQSGNVPSGGSSGGGALAAFRGGVGTPSSTFDSTGSANNQPGGFTAQSALTGSIIDANTTPMRAYVVSDDITTQQRMDRKRQEASTL